MTMTTDGVRKPRNSSVEAFRILLMFLIVSYHAMAAFGGSKGFTSATMVATHWCVDAFVAISGWYGIRFRLRKVAAIVGTIGFYSLLRFVLGQSGVSGVQSDPFVLSGGWFGDSYVALMFMAPLLERALQVSDSSAGGIWTLWGAFAAVVFFNWLPLQRFFPGLGLFPGHHSVLTMCFVYLSARVARSAWERKKVLCPGKVLVGFALLYGCVSGVLTLLALSGRSPFPVGDFGGITYDAPHVVGLGVAAAMFAVTRVRISASVGRLALFLAPSMFGVYLVHTPIVFGVLRECIGLSESPSTAIALSMFAFLTSLGVDLLRRLFVRALKFV